MSPSFLQFFLTLKCFAGHCIESIVILILYSRWLPCGYLADLCLVFNQKRWFWLFVGASIIDLLFMNNYVSFWRLFIWRANISYVFACFLNFRDYGISFGGDFCFKHTHHPFLCRHWEFIRALFFMLVYNSWTNHLFAILTLKYNTALFMDIYLTLWNFSSTLFALYDQLFWAHLSRLQNEVIFLYGCAFRFWRPIILYIFVIFVHWTSSI